MATLFLNLGNRRAAWSDCDRNDRASADGGGIFTFKPWLRLPPIGLVYNGDRPNSKCLFTDRRNNSPTQVLKNPSSMLRCASPGSLPRSLQISYRWSLVCCQSLTEKSCHQIRLLSFLPIVSSLDTAQKTSSPENGPNKHLTFDKTNDKHISDQTASELGNRTSTETPRDADDVDLQGGSHPLSHITFRHHSRTGLSSTVGQK
jgi:hypothetical protein